MSVHINAKKGDIAETILLPGDPLRAKWIAETFFESPVCFNEVRGMYGYTGTYNGKQISAMGTGMGVPSYAVNRANRSQYENNAPMSDWTIECCGNDPVSGTGDGAGSQYHMTMVGCMDQCGSATIY